MSSGDKQDRIYFGGLNGLRFFAASAVIFHHVEQYKLWAIQDGKAYNSIFGHQSIWGNFFDALGHKAVSLFFVLSGFLITYLLLAEVRKTGTVALKKFYVRRILRIWPVYYLIILLTFFVIPHFFDIGNKGAHLLSHNFWVWFALCFFMLPNLVRYNKVELVGGNQTWSVGVEEQFYILWPWLVRTFHKNFEKMLIIFIIVKMIIFLGADAATHVLSGKMALLATKFKLQWGLFKIEQMAVGALGAWYLFHKKEKVLSFIYAKAWVYFVTALLFFIFFVDAEFPFSSIMEAVVFLTIIMNVSTNPNAKLKFTSPRFTILGNISYGIYMYHTLVITVLMTALAALKLDTNMTVFNSLLYIGSFFGSIGLSYLSYRFFETPFLSFKEKFMVVKSSSKG
jgi:peptidoglycan/LPS O-acetylase OafA/YrhL